MSKKERWALPELREDLKLIESSSLKIKSKIVYQNQNHLFWGRNKIFKRLGR